MSEGCVNYEQPKTVIVIGAFVREAEHHVRANWAEYHGERVKVMSAETASTYGLQGIRPSHFRLVLLPGLGLRCRPGTYDRLAEQVKRIDLISPGELEVTRL